MTIQARPTTYNGIKMRSRLEAAWAQAFDRENWEWAYEPQAYADGTGQYLPDFRIITEDDRPWFVEVKGHIEIEDLRDVLKRMEIILSSEPNAFLWLFVGHPEDGFVTFTKNGSELWSVIT